MAKKVKLIFKAKSFSRVFFHMPVYAYCCCLQRMWI